MDQSATDDDDKPLPAPPPPRTQSWSAVAQDFRNFTVAQKSMLAGAAVLFVAILGIAIAKGGPPGRIQQHFSAKLETKATGATTRTRDTPAAMRAVISLNRWIQAIVNMADMSTSKLLVLLKK